MGSYFKIYHQVIENSKKLESIIFNVFVFFKKICQSEEPPLPLSKLFPPVSPIPPFLEKIFHPHPNFQIRGSQPPFPFVKGGSNYVMDKLL